MPLIIGTVPLSSETSKGKSNNYSHRQCELALFVVRLKLQMAFRYRYTIVIVGLEKLKIVKMNIINNIKS